MYNFSGDSGVDSIIFRIQFSLFTIIIKNGKSQKLQIFSEKNYLCWATFKTYLDGGARRTDDMKINNIAKIYSDSFISCGMYLKYKIYIDSFFSENFKIVVSSSQIAHSIGNVILKNFKTEQF